MLPTPYVASLRVYEPITSFGSSDQARWSQIVSRSQSSNEEQRRALQRVISANFLPVKADGAYVIEIDGRKYVAPWSTTIRCWSAMEDFKSSLPISITNFFIPKAVEEAINSTTQIAEDKVSHIITSTWSIPPRWFSVFEPSERLRGEDVDGVYTILRTTISKAKQRCHFAHQAVLNAFGQGPIEQEIAELLSWLSLFNDESIVECDYGGLASYLNRSLKEQGQPGLEADTSIEDVAKSLAGLAAGDGGLAGQGYERLVMRWRRVAAFEQAI
jgi:hypothetical protein